MFTAGGQTGDQTGEWGTQRWTVGARVAVVLRGGQTGDHTGGQGAIAFGNPVGPEAVVLRRSIENPHRQRRWGNYARYYCSCPYSVQYYIQITYISLPIYCTC